MMNPPGIAGTRPRHSFSSGLQVQALKPFFFFFVFHRIELTRGSCGGTKNQGVGVPDVHVREAMMTSADSKAHPPRFANLVIRKSNRRLFDISQRRQTCFSREWPHSPLARYSTTTLKKNGEQIDASHTIGHKFVCPWIEPNNAGNPMATTSTPNLFQKGRRGQQKAGIQFAIQSHF